MALTYPSKSKASLFRLKPFLALERFKLSFTEDGARAWFSSDTGRVGDSKWRKMDSRNLGIAKSMIHLSSWIVLKNLRAAGFEAYLVGGCVRDLLLNKIPKDFDVITTAKLKQVKKIFFRTVIVGQRFPICRVFIKGSLVEVSSFETVAKDSKTEAVCFSQMPTGCDQSDFVRWKNSMNRDFTVNSLFFDPYVNTIFDYNNAMMDLRSLKLRTVTPAHLSFTEDKARILRGLRLAARLNLSFSKETETAIYDLSSSVADLNPSRISLEMNYMLSYGAAEPSVLLLKRFKLLEFLLPFHAAYLSEQADKRLGIRSSMLTKLLFNLDHWITTDRPCDDSLWVALLSFHIALYRNPQHAVVVLTFASLLYNGTWEESIEFARKQAPVARTYVPEIKDTFEYLSDEEIAKRVKKLSMQVKNSVNVLIDMDCLLEAMARFPEPPGSGMVFVPRNIGKRVGHIFDILQNVTSLKAQKRSMEIDYSLLKAGNECEVRFMVGKIILDTLVCGVAKANKDDINVIDPIRLGKFDSMGKGENNRSILPPRDERPPKSMGKDENNRSILTPINERAPKSMGKYENNRSILPPRDERVPKSMGKYESNRSILPPRDERVPKSMGKDENNRSILAPKDEQSPKSVSLAWLFEDASIAAKRQNE